MENNQQAASGKSIIPSEERVQAESRKDCP